MKRGVVLALLAGLVLVSCGRGGGGGSGDIARACNGSDRRAANPQLCRCIQRAASAELSRADQRLAATFFDDPHRAQEIRQSDRPAHEAFWQRYKAFGARAERMCR